MDELNDRQKMFVAEYLKDFNATKAAIRSGYSEDSAAVLGCKNMALPKIKKAISDSLESAGITIERSLLELSKLAYSDITDYIDIDEDTGSTKTKALKNIPIGASRAIECIEEDRIIKENQDGSQIVVHDKYKFKLYSKLKALELIIKHLSKAEDQDLDDAEAKVIGLKDVDLDSL